MTSTPAVGGYASSGWRVRGFAGFDGPTDTPPDSVATEAAVVLHSDEIHIVKPHKHQNGGDPHDKMGDEDEHKRRNGDSYERKVGSKEASNRR
ncbi:hypothetical protein DL764_007246 [Monosporascus ibericus]|uniref:Uncharacterized protein n=1 Tax=Monosporascus ibericus TaxID=155417 RepID=A0A4Q4T5V9_9PEZI|nr:hypothetical protein DL764_007246 [Monosporascus ibericus]